MPRRSGDENTDRLYQLPPSDFTRERNALAKETGGEEGKRIRALPKPSASAWAVNQLYWRDRQTYDTLADAAERLRAAHRAVLGGRKADLLAVDAAHRDAVKAALTSTLRLAREGGQQISSATQTEIARTLESLSREQPPGRLHKPLLPEGFEALQGMPILPRRHEPAPQRPASSAPLRLVKTTARPQEAPKPDARARERQRKEAQRALRAVRERERRDRIVVARLQKEVTAAARRAAAAKAESERAQEAEARLRRELREAEDMLERSANELREMEDTTF